MLTLQATVLNVFRTPTGKTRDGVAYGGKDQVQLQAETILKNGQKRIQLLTLSTDKSDFFRDNLNKVVKVPVGAFVSGSSVQFFILDHGVSK